MAQLTLMQCDCCGYAAFQAGGYGFLKGGELKFEVDACTWRICEKCVETVLGRRGMYELTGDAAKPVKMRSVWPPDREQNKHPNRSS